MKKIVLSLLLGLWSMTLGFSVVGAQDTGSVVEIDEIDIPVPVTVGLYLYDIGNFDYLNHDFTAKLWYWYLYDQDAEISPEEYTEFTNAKELKHQSSSTEVKGDKKRVVGLTQGDFSHDWEPKIFPFDRQHLTIPIENEIYDSSMMQLFVDTTGTAIREGISFGDWELVSFDVTTGTSVYNSTFGDPELSSASISYDVVQASIVLERKTPILLFIKIFLASYLAALAVYLSHLIPQDQTESRFGIGTAALFAAIGNNYIVNNLIPSSAAFTLVDGVQALILSYIIISMIFSIIATIELEEGKRIDQRDTWMLRYGLLIFIIANVFFIYLMIR